MIVKDVHDGYYRQESAVILSQITGRSVSWIKGIHPTWGRIAELFRAGLPSLSYFVEYFFKYIDRLSADDFVLVIDDEGRHSR